MRTLGRLVTLADVPAWRAALSAALGALAVCFGVALLATAGYLISRAAEQPPILSLTVTIVAVRFFGLARPLAAISIGSSRMTSRCARSVGSAGASTSGSSRSRRPSSRAIAAGTCSRG